MLKNWLREPLLHFLLIGAILFLIYDLQNSGELEQKANQIIVSQASIDGMTARWEKKWQRPPAQEELNGLIEQEIRERVLYQEALALGLDKDDPVVRRRLAQKIEFISSDLAAQVEPSEKDLQDYFLANPKQFEQPGLINFVQVYLNVDRRGASLEKEASDMLLELNRPDAEVDISTLGDPFMFGQQHDNLPDFAVSRLFGREFTEAIFDLPTGTWQGPVRSGLGFHLVLVSALAPAQQAELDSVREKVHFEWMAEQRREMENALYQGLRRKYEIVFPDRSTPR